MHGGTVTHQNALIKEEGLPGDFTSLGFLGYYYCYNMRETAVPCSERGSFFWAPHAAGKNTEMNSEHRQD